MDKERVIKTLKNEQKLTDADVTELYWLLNEDQYKERPVTIQEFISSDDFVHKKWPNVFPLWKETLAELFPNPFVAPYNEVLISAAAGCVDKETEVLTDAGWIQIDKYKNENIAVYHEDGTVTYEQPLEYISGKADDVWYHFKNADVDMKLSPEHTVCYYDGDKLTYISAQELSELDKDIELPSPDGRVKLNGKRACLVIPSGIFDMKYCFRTSTHFWMMRRNGKAVWTGNSGKTVTATISIIYDIYKLGCLKNPCTFYGLTPDTMIIMAIFSATGATASVNWNEVTTGIASCPWIMDKLVDKQGFNKKNGSIVPVEIIPGIFIQTGSKFQHSMGKAIFDGLMDEAAFGGANMKDAQKSYNELSSRIKTRFATWGTKGNTPGQLFLISSPKEAGDFMQYRIEETQKANSTLTKIIQNVATWDADPRKDSDDKFTVFIGNENKEPCIYEPEDDIPIEEMDYLLYVPMRYYEEFKKDLLISIMNYGGIATTSDMALFKSVTALNEVFMLQNPFKSDVIELPFSKTDKTLMDFADLGYFKNIRHPEYNRFLHIDAAFSTNTLDVYGLAATYSIFTENSSYTGIGETVSDDIFTKKDRMYIVDFAVGITAPKGQEVPLYKVQDFIEWLVKIGYPIASVSADQFQSKQTLQNLQVKGFNTENISVDKTRDPYLFLRQCVFNKQVLLPKNEYLRDELRKLRDDGKKVDHTPNCFTGDTIVKMLDGKNKTLKELAEQGADKEFWVYSCLPDGTIVPAKAFNAHKSGTANTLLKITLDNGYELRCTPEHLFMLRNGEYKQAKDLDINESLMPLRWHVHRGYEVIWDNFTNRQKATHRQVYEHFNRRYNTETHVIHHYDFNKRNNTPENLILMTWSEHSRFHAKNSAFAQYQLRLNWTPERESERIRKFQKALTEPVREKIRARGRELNATYWKSDEGRKRRAELAQTQLRDASQIYYKQREEIRKQMYEEVADKLRFDNGLSYKHVAQQIGYKKDTSDTIARAIEENHPYDFKQSIINAFETYKFTWNEAKQFFNCNGSTLTYYLRKYNIEYLVKDHKFNHKVISIEWLENINEDVYDITVPEYHNFALYSGIFVHNSHKDIGDAVAGSLWACANSNEVINRGRVAHAYFSGGIGSTANPDKLASAEIMEFERIKQNMSQMFKGF